MIINNATLIVITYQKLSLNNCVLNYRMSPKYEAN